MKKSWLVFLILLVSFLTLKAVSAQSLNEILQSVDPSTIISAILFVLFFAVFYYSSSKIFTYKSHNPLYPYERVGNKGVAAVVSIALSALIVYGINTTPVAGSFVSGFFTSIGLTGGTLYTIGSLLFIGLAIFLFAKLRSLAFYILGGIFIIASITGWTFGIIYNSSLSFIIGISLEFIGLVISLIRRRRNQILEEYPERFTRRTRSGEERLTRRGRLRERLRASEESRRAGREARRALERRGRIYH